MSLTSGTMTSGDSARAVMESIYITDKLKALSNPQVLIEAVSKSGLKLPPEPEFQLELAELPWAWLIVIKEAKSGAIIGLHDFYQPNPD